jgi:flavin reductase (DIM6/NTAB) family NADH-FMN oxidoreductase RutF
MTAPSTVDATAFRRFLGRWPTGVTILTAGVAGQPVGCTVSTLMCASYDPPVLVASLARSSRTLEAIRGGGAFGVNLLPWDRRELAERFARAPLEARFDGVRYTVRHGVPILAGAAGTAVCVLRDLVPVADKVLLIGEPAECDDDDAARMPLILLDRRPHRPATDD